jgi:hypothetical protein
VTVSVPAAWVTSAAVATMTGCAVAALRAGTVTMISVLEIEVIVPGG